MIKKENEIYYDKICGILDIERACTFYVNPTEISKAVGNRRKNITRIKEKYSIDIKIMPDINLKKGEIIIGRNEL